MPRPGRIPLRPLTTLLAGRTPAPPVLTPAGTLTGSAPSLAGRFARTAAPVDPTPGTAEPGQEDSTFGWSVAWAGDGYADGVRRGL